ncbi:MAG: hypothetical protein ACLQVD_16810 [Capsulimonadaceae bacterium]
MMEKKTSYYCNDGRAYDVTMSWNEKFRDSDKIFAVDFKAVDKQTGRLLSLPKEIATYAIGDVEETLGERVKFYHNGNRDEMVADWVTTAWRRVGDYIERGK